MPIYFLRPICFILIQGFMQFHSGVIRKMTVHRTPVTYVVEGPRQVSSPDPALKLNTPGCNVTVGIIETGMN